MEEFATVQALLAMGRIFVRPFWLLIVGCEQTSFCTRGWGGEDKVYYLWLLFWANWCFLPDSPE